MTLDHYDPSNELGDRVTYTGDPTGTDLQPDTTYLVHGTTPSGYVILCHGPAEQRRTKILRDEYKRHRDAGTLERS